MRGAQKEVSFDIKKEKKKLGHGLMNGLFTSLDDIGFTMDCMIFMTGVLLWLVESSLARLVLDLPELIPQPSIIVYSFTFFSLFILSFLLNLFSSYPYIALSYGDQLD